MKTTIGKFEACFNNMYVTHMVKYNFQGWTLLVFFLFVKKFSKKREPQIKETLADSLSGWLDLSDPLYEHARLKPLKARNR